MADNKIEQKREHQQHDAAVRDDLLWTNKLAASQSQALSGRVMPTLKSRVSGVIDERFEQFLKKLEDKGLLKGAQATAQRLPSDTANRPDLKLKADPGDGQGVTLVRGVFDRALGETSRFSPTAAGTESRDERPTRAADTERATHSKLSQAQQQIARAAEVSQRSWVVFASQLIGANLNRIGVSPSEIDDIRLFLIRQGAASYDELNKLTRLPDSLDPSAQLKALEDIKTLMLAYVVQATQEQILSDIETGNDKEPIELPKTTASRYLGIPEIDVDPNKLIEMGVGV